MRCSVRSRWSGGTRPCVRREASPQVRPLSGVPIAIKDNIPVAGEPMRTGSAATSVVPRLMDHPVVQRVRAAGAIPVGLTRVPEMCVWGTTDSAFGITRNPWSPGRTPGGSSGGSAVAVAAGMVPVAHGADGMGSIRIPAACVGIVGLKPGTGVVPAELGVNDWYGMSENGVFATTVVGCSAAPVGDGRPARAGRRWTNRVTDCGSRCRSARRSLECDSIPLTRQPRAGPPRILSGEGHRSSARNSAMPTAPRRWPP